MKAIILLVLVAFFRPTRPQVPDVLQRNDSQENMTFFLYEDENGEIFKEDLTGPVERVTVYPMNLTYYFFSKSNPTTGVPIYSNSISTLSQTAFNASKGTLFIIHGWRNSHKSDVNSNIRDIVLKYYDINLFVVDWSPIAGKLYLTAHAAVNEVGSFVGAFVKSLQNTYDLKLAGVKFVGHSLGAHVSGCAGKALNGQVDRIVGLDPAGPLFSCKDRSDRLDESDAKYVQVIHTNDGNLGLNCQMGHSDFYPNGGRTQPGCGVIVTGVCSHVRSYKYYAESLNSDRFVARQCGSMADYKNGKCADGHRSSMGQFYCDIGAHGKYYLETNAKSPFAKG